MIEQDNFVQHTMCIVKINRTFYLGVAGENLNFAIEAEWKASLETYYILEGSMRV